MIDFPNENACRQGRTHLLPSTTLPQLHHHFCSDSQTLTFVVLLARGFLERIYQPAARICLPATAELLPGLPPKSSVATHADVSVPSPLRQWCRNGPASPPLSPLPSASYYLLRSGPVRSGRVRPCFPDQELPTSDPLRRLTLFLSFVLCRSSSFVAGICIAPCWVAPNFFLSSSLAGWLAANCLSLLTGWLCCTEQ